VFSFSDREKMKRKSSVVAAAPLDSSEPVQESQVPVTGNRPSRSAASKPLAVKLETAILATPQPKKIKISHKRTRSHTAPAVTANDENAKSVSNRRESVAIIRSGSKSKQGKQTHHRAAANIVKSTCLALLEELKGLKDPKGRQLATIFAGLPSKEHYPDYYAVIQRPISLHEIKNKANEYKDVVEVKADLDLMFDNATTYNIEGSEVYKDAVYLKVCYCCIAESKH
jgi:hypothetical protein